MNPLKLSSVVVVLGMFIHVFFPNYTFADDTCVFEVTANDVAPNIVFYLDNGAEMEQVTWHSSFDSTSDYTPAGDVDVVESGVATGTGFYNENGYAIDYSNKNFPLLVKIQDNFLLDLNNGLLGVVVDGNPTWTINGKPIYLPPEAQTVEIDGATDNATNLRYSKNYLNWLFFTNEYTGNGTAAGDVDPIDPTDDALSDKSRFFWAKSAIISVMKETANRAQFSIFYFTNEDGATQKQPLKYALLEPLADPSSDNELSSEFKTNINGMRTTNYSPLAEGLATVGDYFNSSESHLESDFENCSQNFIIALTPGVSSMDLGDTMGASTDEPDNLADYDADGEGATITLSDGNNNDVTYTIPFNIEGSTYFDDVASYLYSNDIGFPDGYQNIRTYTIGFMGSTASNVFLANTSNNGNGLLNLYDTSDLDCGKYHFEAQVPSLLAEQLMNAINSILEETSAFAAPVVPVTRTTSGDRLYMSFFTLSNSSNFWEGNVIKLGLNSSNQIVDSLGLLATYDNGALKETAVPYWATINWADTSKGNGISNQARNIYTYLGGTTSLLDTSNEFISTNALLTASILGSPTLSTSEIINYVRGADVTDEDADGDVSENRSLITGDILHSEPFVYTFTYPDSDNNKTMIFVGSNDGMLHAINDTDGTEAWGFIPPNQLHKLKDILEGPSHQYFVDSSPKIYLYEPSAVKNGIIDTASGDRVILVCGERKGSNGYFALDVTDPLNPSFMWRISDSSDPALDPASSFAAPNYDISVLGESWSEPEFGLVKTTDLDTDTGTAVMFIGGGYSDINANGNAVLAINVLDGSPVMTFTAGMNYSIPSKVRLVDANDNGFVDKIYVGDMGGQMWRVTSFYDGLTFPDTNENILRWTALVLYDALDTTKKFFYQPTVTLENGFDLVFAGSGDRENPCVSTGYDVAYAIKDNHVDLAVSLVDVTLGASVDLAGDDFGWYLSLAMGEKVLSEGTVFAGVYYFTTFTPNDDPCVPGGIAKLYGVDYLTGIPAVDFNGDGIIELSTVVGGGIPSKPVFVINDSGIVSIFISVGSTNADEDIPSTTAGIKVESPLTDSQNFFYLWWKQLFN